MPVDKVALRRKFKFRCGYCGVREADVGAELTVDHFQPRSRGGTDDADNAVYCCPACNVYKGDVWEPAAARRILHPLRDDPAAHLADGPDGTLRGLTETGTFHLERLRLNRPPLVEHRRERLALDRARQAERALLNRLRELDGRLEELLADLDRLRPGGASDLTG